MTLDKRIFELWLGSQASGKTFALNRRIHQLARSDLVSSIWVLDSTGEWPLDTSIDDLVVIEAWHEYRNLGDELPRVIVFRNALEWVTWPRLVEEAQAQGKVLLVIDEAYNWLPSAGALEPSARSAILSGRHLPALDRRLYPLHIIAAAQYPRSVHHLLHEQAPVIITGRLEGELAESWVVGNFGREAWEHVAALEQWQFVTLRGERPAAPGVRWQR
jgi:hypothetical protein